MREEATAKRQTAMAAAAAGLPVEAAHHSDDEDGPQSRKGTNKGTSKKDTNKVKGEGGRFFIYNFYFISRPFFCSIGNLSLNTPH